MDYYRPRTRDEAWQLRESIPGARYIAGGTDLLVKLLHRPKARQPPALISLRHVDGLHGVTVHRDTLRLGACTPLADLLVDPAVRRCPVLVEAMRSIGGVQIRNVATLGGNIANASPCADSVPPLLVLDAQVQLEGPQGVREIPIDEVLLAPGRTQCTPGEILTAILIESCRSGWRAAFLKKGRVRMDLAQASVAVALDLEGDRCRSARVAAGAVAPTPIRLRGVEAMLAGATLTPTLLGEVEAAARAEVNPISDVRASEAYRRQIVGVYVRRAIERLLGWRAS